MPRELRITNYHPTNHQPPTTPPSTLIPRFTFQHMLSFWSSSVQTTPFTAPSLIRQNWLHWCIDIDCLISYPLSPSISPSCTHSKKSYIFDELTTAPHPRTSKSTFKSYSPSHSWISQTRAKILSLSHQIIFFKMSLNLEKQLTFVCLGEYYGATRHWLMLNIVRGLPSQSYKCFHSYDMCAFDSGHQSVPCMLRSFRDLENEDGRHADNI